MARFVSVASENETGGRKTSTNSFSSAWTLSNEPSVTSASIQAPAIPELSVGSIWHVSSNFILDALMVIPGCGILASVSRKTFWTKLNEVLAWSKYVLFESCGTDAANMVERLRISFHVLALEHTGKQ